MTVGARELALTFNPNAYTEGGMYWRIPCPAHGGRDDHNCAIWDGDNGSIGAKCFSRGCRRRDIVSALYKHYRAVKEPHPVTLAQRIEDMRQVAHKQRLYRQWPGCTYCKQRMLIDMLQIDHVIPKSKGGASVLENYQLLCERCNSIKGDHLQPFRQLSWLS